MYKKSIFVLIVVAMNSVLFSEEEVRACMKKNLILINNLNDIVDMFSHDADSIAQYKEYAMQEVRQRLDAVIAIPAEKRTWQNTPNEFSKIEGASDLMIFIWSLVFLNKLSKEQSIHHTVSVTLKEVHNFLVDMQMMQDRYRAFMEYVDGPMQHEKLSDEQRYYITEKVKGMKRSGLNLPEEEREKIKACRKKLGERCLDFSQNIVQDQSSISVYPDELTGLDQDFINGLKKDGDKVILGVDYPTVFKVQSHCSNGEVRKKLCFAFRNRAYPANEDLLYDIIALRDELAKLLGFESYAAYQLEDGMAGSVEEVESFLATILERAMEKEAQEYALMCKHLPDGVALNEDGTLNPWDVGFIKETYRNNFYNLDQDMLAEYFPMENTIAGLLSIYERFFGLKMQQVPISGLWSDEVRALEVVDTAAEQKLGYILLDLHPRPFKYPHACAGAVVPATLHNGKPTTHLSIVIANFPKPTEEKPSLLRPDDAITFFHEFGHALHNMLGRQEIASLSGTRVKRDFVEMPSQMLEEWLWDKDIIKMLSCHYQTGEPLPDKVIDTLIAAKNLFEGSFLQFQISSGMLSLSCFKEGAEKNVKELGEKIHMSCRPHIAYQPDMNRHCSFNHLMNYGAGYYGYLWSKVFALDLFNEIKKHGLLDASIGKKYRDLVIGKGGSKDPNELLRDFLGREPNSDAFFRDLGI